MKKNILNHLDEFRNIYDEEQERIEAELNFKEWAVPIISEKFNLKFSFSYLSLYAIDVKQFVEELREKYKIGSFQPTIDETPEDIFDSYEKSRSLKDYQKLWNLGIKLHEIRGNQWVECDYFDPRPEQSFIKVYDMIDGRLKFTKIGVYEIKK